MIEETLILAAQLTALVVFLGIVAVFFKGHRYLLRKLTFHLVPRIRKLPWAKPPTEAAEERRLGISMPRVKWKAAWYFAGLVAGSTLGLLIGFAAARGAFWGHEVFESLFASASTGRRSNADYDPVGNAAHGITMMLITGIITLPFVLSGASIGLTISQTIVSADGRSSEQKLDHSSPWTP
jgi:hypothetical protein